MILKPSLCGNTMQITYIDCYAFSLVTLMGAELSNRDTAKSIAGREGIRNFESHNTIVCKDENNMEVEVPFHAVKTFESHIVTDPGGEAAAVRPNSPCLTTELDAPICD